MCRMLHINVEHCMHVQATTGSANSPSKLFTVFGCTIPSIMKMSIPNIQMQICFLTKKNRKLANIRPSLHFYGMTILVKTKPLCIGMAWLPFQKISPYFSIKLTSPYTCASVWHLNKNNLFPALVVYFKQWLGALLAVYWKKVIFFGVWTSFSITNGDKKGLQPVSRPVEQVHYFGGWVQSPFGAKTLRGDRSGGARCLIRPNFYVVWTLFTGFCGQGVHFWGKNKRKAQKIKIHKKGDLPRFMCYSQMLVDTKKLVDSKGKYYFSLFCVKKLYLWVWLVTLWYNWDLKIMFVIWPSKILVHLYLQI